MGLFGNGNPSFANGVTSTCNLYAPSLFFKKSGYIVNGRSVDKAMSPVFLSTPFLESSKPGTVDATSKSH